MPDGEDQGARACALVGSVSHARRADGGCGRRRLGGLFPGENDEMMMLLVEVTISTLPACVARSGIRGVKEWIILLLSGTIAILA